VDRVGLVKDTAEQRQSVFWCTQRLADVVLVATLESRVKPECLT